MPVGRDKLTFEYIEIMAAGMRAAELGELFGIPVKPDFQIFVLGHLNRPGFRRHFFAS